MDRVIIVLIIIQLITTAFGLAVIESVRPLINKGLRDRGYILRNKNSLYNFSSTITDIAKGFIPFYYFSKAIAIISNKDRISDLINDEINSGKYLTLEDVENRVQTFSLAEQIHLLNFIANNINKQSSILNNQYSEEESLQKIREASLATVWETVKNDTW